MSFGTKLNRLFFKIYIFFYKSVCMFGITDGWIMVNFGAEFRLAELCLYKRKVKNTQYITCIIVKYGTKCPSFKSVKLLNLSYCTVCKTP